MIPWLTTPQHIYHTFFQAVICSLLLSTLGSGHAQAQIGVAFGIPPQPVEAKLQSVAPDDCLVYASWEGTAEPSAESGNRTEALLSEPEIQHILTLVTGLLDQALAGANDNDPMRPEIFFNRWGRKVITSPAAFYVQDVAFGETGLEVNGGFLVKLGNDSGRLVQTIASIYEQESGQRAEAVVIDELKCLRAEFPGGKFTWGASGDWFLLAFGEGEMEALAKRLSGEAPEWLTDAIARTKVNKTSGYLHVNGTKGMALGCHVWRP